MFQEYSITVPNVVGVSDADPSADQIAIYDADNDVELVRVPGGGQTRIRHESVGAYKALRLRINANVNVDQLDAGSVTARVWCWLGSR